MMVPNASVTIARYGPVTRSAGNARMAPNRAVTPMAATKATMNGAPTLSTSTPAVYAPIPNRPACPSDTCPV